MAPSPRREDHGRRVIKLVDNQTLPETQMDLVTEWRAVPADFKQPALTVVMLGEARREGLEISLETTRDAVERNGVHAWTVLSRWRVFCGTHWSVIPHPVGPWVPARVRSVLGRPWIVSAYVAEGTA